MAQLVVMVREDGARAKVRPDWVDDWRAQGWRRADEVEADAPDPDEEDAGAADEAPDPEPEDDEGEDEASDLRAQLDEAGIEYDGRWGVKRLRKALEEGQ